jgi:hypothetical protein
LQPASDDPTNEFINNLFNSFGGSSIGGGPLYNSEGEGLTADDPWYY